MVREVNIKYIFCVSTGRCGTDYLAGLFKSIDNCEVYHEQKPLLHNEVITQQVNNLMKILGDCYETCLNSKLENIEFSELTSDKT